jgi:AcrR family transcriptional regulator
MSDSTVTRRRPSVSKRRTRLSPEARGQQIMDAAARLIVQQGFLPLTVEQIAQATQASKGLFYAYFPTQYDLYNALLRRELNGLVSAGMETAARVNDFDQAGLLCGMLYFEHVAQSGPLLHLLTNDLYMKDHIDPAAIQAGAAILQRLTRLTRDALKVSRKEALAALEMLAAIPEEAGSLAFHRTVELPVARDLCHTLLSGGLEALRTADRRLTMTGHDAA